MAGFMGVCSVTVPDRPRKNILFVSSNGQWGGSEELWRRAAMRLAQAGHHVAVLKPHLWRHRDMRAVTALIESGCHVADLRGPRWLPQKARSLVSILWPLMRPMTIFQFGQMARRHGADIVVISQGINHDGWLEAKQALARQLPFVIISQKADDIYWPDDDLRDHLRSVYPAAASALFVSEHNRALTEIQVGQSLPNARVIRNPFDCAWDAAPAWPAAGPILRLACLARLDIREKGQDILFRVLAQPKWRKRALSVTLYGSGHNQQGLESMAAQLNLSSVAFAGFTERPDAIWADHHGLILPSRCEGLPLSLVESMLNGRVPIVTDVGGNAEVVVDGVTGFIAASASDAALDAALERAWQARDQWQTIGAAAARSIRAYTVPDPVGAFCDALLDIVA